MAVPGTSGFRPFRIEWGGRTRAQWDAMFAACRRTTLTQSSTYALALAETAKVRADFGLIRFENRPIGLVVAHGRPILGRPGSQSIYRGPIWIHDEIPGAMQKLVLSLLRRRFRLWRGRPVTFHPELADTPAHRAQLAEAGFRHVAPGYRTRMVDLSPSVEELRANLARNWHSALKQGERHRLAVVDDGAGARLDWLVERHGAHMAHGGYRGLSGELLRALHRHGNATAGLRLLVADADGEAVSGIALARHGDSATYLVGWTGEAGRALRATHVLLWRAMGLLKADGARWFDLGGIPDDAPGIATFKAGLGGAELTLVGGYV